MWGARGSPKIVGMTLQAPIMTRVEMVQATAEMLEAELRDPRELAKALRAELPADWPPEHHVAGTIACALRMLEDPANFGWGTHYFLAQADDGRPTLAGVGGYVGAPANDSVEIGYSVVPSQQRRGIATQAAKLLTETARNRGVHIIRANTLPHLEPSIGVLRKLGFVPAPPAEPGVATFELRRRDHA